LPLSEQPARVYSLWTLKESWMKATGRGLAAGLDNAAFSLDDKHQLVGLNFAAYDATDWRFWQFTPTHEHVLALAVRAPGAARDANVTTFEWRPGEMSTPL
jgi:4'-phosphopantetheinyl transferase